MRSMLSNDDNNTHGQHWFEETICEAASLYTLREMSDQWLKDPPFENWREYAHYFDEYAGDRILAAMDLLDKPFQLWFAEHVSVMRDTRPWRRNMFLVVAVELLELFEAQPQHWASIAYLNTDQKVSAQSFEQYLQNWHDNSPEQHQRFIRQVSGKLGVLTYD